MQTKTKDFIANVRDEVDLLRNNDFEVDELTVEAIHRNSPMSANSWLRKLHYPMTRAVGKLPDSQRHQLFSAIFGKQVKSAYNLTNVEIEALDRIIDTKVRDNDYADIIKDIVNG